jgi:fructoselysine-6-P-deglycase FrlB-like protein
MEYRHGAHCIAGEGSLVWFLSPPPDRLATMLADAGATVRIGAHDAQVELIAVQRLAVELAVLRGLDPDRPRNLDRSVVLA